MTILASLLLFATSASALVEAEAFEDFGGWTVDQQFMDQMGSPYLLAHGRGKPVAEAVTHVKMAPGTYRLWVRTRDWCRPMAAVGPGAFRVTVNGEDLGTFGTGGRGEWEWTAGPEVSVTGSPAEIRLCDLSGFEGRVDALFFATGDEKPPETWVARKRLLGLGKPADVTADFVVVGGGIAGLCAAVTVAAGAEWRWQPETQAETGERLAPDGKRKGGDYGSSLLWFARTTEESRAFPSCPWALSVDRAEDALLGREADGLPSGGWNWETGFWEDNVTDGEKIRDRLFRAIYGVWDFTKNKRADKAKFATAEIYWMGFVLGKRAARRVIGDYVLTEQDLEQGVVHPDGVVTTDWYIDLHFPHPVVERRFGRDVFRSTAYDATRAEDKVNPAQYVGGKVEIRPFAIPFRCLYSKDVPNLFLAGKDISATHVAMGSHRVMNTGGAMGTVVGKAASLCVKRGWTPRELGADHFAALAELLR